MEKVFLDTSALKALIDSKDDFHTLAIEYLEKNRKTTFVTSNYILDESFTLVRMRCGLERALELRKLLKKNPLLVEIYRVTVNDEANAWNWFLNNWKGLSFTDCVSFAMMKRLQIGKVFSFDKHFEKAGFEMVGSK